MKQMFNQTRKKTFEKVKAFKYIPSSGGQRSQISNPYPYRMTKTTFECQSQNVYTKDMYHALSLISKLQM